MENNKKTTVDFYPENSNSKNIQHSEDTHNPEKNNSIGTKESDDVREINVTYSTPINTPIVVMYGPASCGKTMIIIRLSLWLKKYYSRDYSITPEQDFRNSTSKNFKNSCENFNALISSEKGAERAADSTDQYSFILLSVKKGSTYNTIFQILEVPGEHCKNPFPKYLTEVLKSNSYRNNRIVIIVLDADTKQEEIKSTVENIEAIEFQQKENRRLKVIILYNKIDILISKANLPFHFNNKLIQTINGKFNNICELFRNKTPIIKWFKPYNCQIVPFSTGIFGSVQDDDGKPKKTYTPGDDIYPKMLWRAIRNLIRF